MAVGTLKIRLTIHKKPLLSSLPLQKETGILVWFWFRELCSRADFSVSQLAIFNWQKLQHRCPQNGILSSISHPQKVKATHLFRFPPIQRNPCQSVKSNIWRGGLPADPKTICRCFINFQMLRSWNSFCKICKRKVRVNYSLRLA